ncbi:MAG TPA: type II secretion system protein [Bacteroidetes bacterium]|nr:type II secretion system protein [Bacteroidota bacterium]
MEKAKSKSQYRFLFFGKLTTLQAGVTLVEMLLVIAVLGILFVALMNIFQVSVTSFDKITTRSNFYHNAAKLLNLIVDEIKGVDQMKVVGDSSLSFQKSGTEFRYRLHQVDGQYYLIREKKLFSGEWEQSPKILLAQFPVPAPMLKFEKKSPRQLFIEICQNNKKMSTTGFCRIGK